MTTNEKSDTVNTTVAAGDAAQTAYNNAKVPHTTHSDVAKSIHQMNDAEIKAHTVQGNPKTSVRTEATVAVKKAGTHAVHKDADVAGHNAPHVIRTSAHPEVPVAVKKAGTHTVHKDADVAGHNASHGTRTSTLKAASDVKVAVPVVGPESRKK